jgi:hypothetical protein
LFWLPATNLQPSYCQPVATNLEIMAYLLNIHCNTGNTPTQIKVTLGRSHQAPVRLWAQSKNEYFISIF